MTSPSIWTLKRKPLHEIVAYIRTHGAIKLQAEMAGMALEPYRALSEEQAGERLAGAIAAMDDELYTDYLLAIIDE